MKITIFSLFCAYMVLADDTVLNPFLLESKVLNKNKAISPEMYFVASLQINGSHFCSGCYISWRNVLTSAHCVHHIYAFGGINYAFASVMISNTNTSTTGNQITRGVTAIEHHPAYNPMLSLATSDYDIGVIMVDSLIPYFGTLLLDLSTNYVASSIIADMAGWLTKKSNIPAVSYSKTRIPTSLDKVSVEIEDIHKCQDFFPLGNFLCNQMCGFKKNSDQRNILLKGDAGSPLILANKVILGVVSDKNEHSVPGPVFFVRVNNYVPYINDAMFRLLSRNVHRHSYQRVL